MDRFPEYSAEVWAHFREPHNVGGFSAGSDRVLIGRAGTRRHGREVEFQLQLAPDGRVSECRYRVYGCPATIALCSLASEALKDRAVAEAATLSVMALAGQLGLSAEKRDAALTVEDAIRAAAARYNSAQGLSPSARVLQPQV